MPLNLEFGRTFTYTVSQPLVTRTRGLEGLGQIINLHRERLVFLAAALFLSCPFM
jgi:hypothetical protein